MIHASGNQVSGKDNNYLIGKNLFNAFVVGEIGSSDDFFLVGAEPIAESNYPLLTGNFLDSEGSFLFRLVKNILVVNPGHCLIMDSSPTTYEIHDVNDHLILRVESRFEPTVIKEPNPMYWNAVTSGDWTTVPQDTPQWVEVTKDFWITTIEGTFFNKAKVNVLTTQKDNGLIIPSDTKCGLGFVGNGFFIANHMSQEEIQRAVAILASHGSLP